MEQSSLSPALLASLTRLVEYLLDDEASHYEADPQPNHIFKDVESLRDWLASVNPL